MRNELSPLASGSSGSMPNISKARLQNLLVPLPPIDLQLKYKEVVNEFWSYKGYQHQTTLHTDNLFNLLLQKAFRGNYNHSLENMPPSIELSTKFSTLE